MLKNRCKLIEMRCAFSEFCKIAAYKGIAVDFHIFISSKREQMNDISFFLYAFRVKFSRIFEKAPFI